MLRGGADGLAVAFACRGGEVVVDVVAAGAASSDDVAFAIEAARGIAGVDDDPTEFFSLARRHPLVAKLARTADPRMCRTPTVFEAYARAVIEQLVTGLEARASIARLTRLAGEELPGTGLHAPPTPEAVRRVPMWKMHTLGIGSRRAATLRSGALRGPALERLRGVPASLAIEKLQSIRGVGPWTANAVARDAFAWADAVPVGDLHAPYVITAALTGEEGDDAAMLAALEPFRPHRARVVLVIEHSFTRAGLPNAGRWRPPRVDPHRREPWRY